MALRTKIFSLFIAAFLAILVVGYYIANRISRELINEYITDIVEDGHNDIEVATQAVSEHLIGFTLPLTQNKELIQAMRAGDRPRLYELSRPYFENWQRLSGVTHFNFHTPDGHNLLRMHMRENHGDLITRQSLKMARETGEPGVVCEVGLTGEWVHRVVVPWEVRGELIGYIELGIDMEHIYAKAVDKTSPATLLVLKKSAIKSPDIWNKRRLQLGLSPFGWDTLSNYVVIIQTGEPLPPSFLQHLEPYLEKADLLTVPGYQNLFVHIHPFSGPTSNVNIGAELQLVDASHIRAVVRNYYQLASMIGIGAMILIFLSIYRYLGHVQYTLDTEEQRIKTALDEKTAELLEYQRDLEDLIAARTVDLMKAQSVAHVGSWTLDLSTQVLSWSLETYRIFGVPTDTPVDLDKFVSLIHPEDREKVLAAWNAALSGAPYNIDHRILSGDQVRWVHESAEFERTAVGGATRALGTVQDITERTRLVEELRHYQQNLETIVSQRTQELQITNAELLRATNAKSEFLANMSHEIRTPMNAILGMTHLILQSELNPKQRDQLKIVQTSGKNLLGIINDILDFSKIEAGKLALEQKAFRLGDVIEELFSAQTLKAEEGQLKLEYETDPDVETALIGDRLRLWQILNNLIGNAIKFSNPGGRIRVRVEQVEHGAEEVCLKFSVKDDGVGIEPADQALLFKPFSQADASTTRKYGGTGLGLAICKDLTELMQGEIWVASTPGVGSTFSFTARFGVDKQDEPRGPAYDEELLANALNKLRGARILLVEDNEINQELANDLLLSKGMVPMVVGNGQEALDILENVEFDGILMDCQMPIMDGYEATRLIRQQARFATLPIIAMTANAMAGDRDKVLRAGMNDHIAKPFDIPEMFTTLAKWISPSSKAA